jgi:hypothetical protein
MTEERVPYYKQTYSEHEALMREKAERIFYDIPHLPAWVGVKVIFPFHGAVARVMFYDKLNNSNAVSSYLDAFNSLGHMKYPYFEIYPDKQGDVSRFYSTDQEEMYPEIIKSLKKQRRDRSKRK